MMKKKKKEIQSSSNSGRLIFTFVLFFFHLVHPWYLTIHNGCRFNGEVRGNNSLSRFSTGQLIVENNQVWSEILRNISQILNSFLNLIASVIALEPQLQEWVHPHWVECGSLFHAFCIGIQLSLHQYLTLFCNMHQGTFLSVRHYLLKELSVFYSSSCSSSSVSL